MLFNSIEFLVVFLPVVMISFFGARCFFCSLKLKLLIISFSFVFYGYYNPENIILLVMSITINYIFSLWLSSGGGVKLRFLLVSVSCIFNLSLIFYYKYYSFTISVFVGNVQINHPSIANDLPLAISFFTFQQIAYVVDCYRQKIQRPKFTDYILFVSFFPQLIAGPIVNFRYVADQFASETFGQVHAGKIVNGLALLVIGLFKKVLIADYFAPYADIVFHKSSLGQAMPFFELWAGVFAFTLQIYFDFSAYSDMALGLALLFGVSLPINFSSPYKACSIIDFWRRWHITLSAFLRDYLYIPLGGNRLGVLRHYTNIVLVMLLGGLWHGAAWNFIVWGTLHGGYILVNHASRNVFGELKGRFANLCSYVLTFFAVVIAWVYFRAPDVSTANHMIGNMLAPNEIVLPYLLSHVFGDLGEPFTYATNSRPWYGALSHDVLLGILLVLLGVVFAPNSNEIVFGQRKRFIVLPKNALVGLVAGFIFTYCVIVISMRETEAFLYFRF